MSKGLPSTRVRRCTCMYMFKRVMERGWSVLWFDTVAQLGILLGEIWTMVAWSTMVNHGQTMVNHGWPWSTMVTWPWSTMVSIVSMVDHGQPCFGQVDHGQTWSFSNLTMVDHGHYKLSMSDYGQPWSNVKVNILTMVDHGWSSLECVWPWPGNFKLWHCLTMVKHGWSTFKKMTVLITIAKNEYHVTVL